MKQSASYRSVYRCPEIDAVSERSSELCPHPKGEMEIFEELRWFSSTEPACAFQKAAFSCSTAALLLRLCPPDKSDGAGMMLSPAPFALTDLPPCQQLAGLHRPQIFCKVYWKPSYRKGNICPSPSHPGAPFSDFFRKKISYKFSDNVSLELAA